jgi:hypothetical protein
MPNLALSAEAARDFAEARSWTESAMRIARTYQTSPELDVRLDVLDQAEARLDPTAKILGPYLIGLKSAYEGEFVPGASRRANTSPDSVAAEVGIATGRIALATVIARGEITPDNKVGDETMGSQLAAIGRTYHNARKGPDQTVAAKAVVVGAAAETAAGRSKLAWQMRIGLTLGRTFFRHRDQLSAVWGIFYGNSDHYGSRRSAFDFSANLTEFQN